MHHCCVLYKESNVGHFGNESKITETKILVSSNNKVILTCTNMMNLLPKDYEMTRTHVVVLLK
jgi:hypothetical protein